MKSHRRCEAQIPERTGLLSPLITIIITRACQELERIVVSTRCSNVLESILSVFPCWVETKVVRLKICIQGAQPGIWRGRPGGHLQWAALGLIDTLSALVMIGTRKVANFVLEIAVSLSMMPLILCCTTALFERWMMSAIAAIEARAAIPRSIPGHWSIVSLFVHVNKLLQRAGVCPTK